MLLQITTFLVVTVALLGHCDARAPAIFLNHGPGSRTWFEPNSIDNVGIIADWRRIGNELRANRPRAIIFVNAHYEENVITIARYDSPPPIMRDLGSGHPEGLEYPVRGSPEVADKLANAFAAAGIESEFSYDRGLDHGINDESNKKEHTYRCISFFQKQTFP
jgi:4,5-DOPA dioxygenase extradiol